MNKKQTILIVDDTKENIDVLIELLSIYDLIPVLSGEDALEIVENEDIDLVLLDIMMPEMDGFEVCEILKNNHKTKNIPIIFLSAKDKHDDIQKGFELGAVDYITKPFNPHELLSRVNTHLNLRAYEKSLEKRVAKELEKNKLKQQIIYQQSKQAALGELLMHIAHQWKQPLASLGSINLLNKNKLEKDIKISEDDIKDTVERSEKLIMFMSDTIDTFKEFYQPHDNSEYFLLTNAITNILNISNATLEYENIEITIDSTEENEIYANENEFNQAIFSIINNTRNISKLNNIKEPQLKIEIKDKKISLSDNCGGIDSKNMDKIFLPYESATGGDGIGLYIARELIEKNGGVITVGKQ